MAIEQLGLRHFGRKPFLLDIEFPPPDQHEALQPVTSPLKKVALEEVEEYLNHDNFGVEELDFFVSRMIKLLGGRNHRYGHLISNPLEEAIPGFRTVFHYIDHGTEGRTRIDIDDSHIGGPNWTEDINIYSAESLTGIILGDRTPFYHQRFAVPAPKYQPPTLVSPVLEKELPLRDPLPPGYMYDLGTTLLSSDQTRNLCQRIWQNYQIAQG